MRPLPSRARRHLKEAHPRYRVDHADAARIARALFVAARDGDSTALSALLADDVGIHSDGGGRVVAFLNVMHGIDRD